MRTMTKSVLQVVRDALVAGEVALPTSASRFSRHDYMRPQLYALLVLRRFLRTDYPTGCRAASGAQGQAMIAA